MEKLKELAMKQKKTLEEEIREMQKEIGKKQKEINALDQILQSDAKEEQKEKIETEKEEKHPKRNKDHEKNQHDQGHSSRYDEEERAKKYYVIYNGSSKGIYDHWSKAAPFIVGKNVTHKSFLSLQEAKDSLREFEQSYVAQLQKPVSEASRIIKGKMVNLGTIPRLPTISQIQTRAERQEQAKLTQEKFNENLAFLINYSDADKITNIYPASTGGYTGPKAVTLPEADPLKVYLLFQSGLIHTIYFRGESIFQYFPAKIQQTIKQYISKILHDREGFLRCYATIPYFPEGGEDITENAVQLCQLGVSNQNYPDMYVQSPETNEDPLEQFLNNYTLILIKGIKINGRINYAAKSIIIWSQQTKGASEYDITLLNEFLERLIKNQLSYDRALKESICERLKEEFNKDHSCEVCQIQDNSSAEAIVESD